MHHLITILAAAGFGSLGGEAGMIASIAIWLVFLMFYHEYDLNLRHCLLFGAISPIIGYNLVLPLLGTLMLFQHFWWSVAIGMTMGATICLSDWGIAWVAGWRGARG